VTRGEIPDAHRLPGRRERPRGLGSRAQAENGEGPPRQGWVPRAVVRRFRLRVPRIHGQRGLGLEVLHRGHRRRGRPLRRRAAPPGKARLRPLRSFLVLRPGDSRRRPRLPCFAHGVGGRRRPQGAPGPIPARSRKDGPARSAVARAAEQAPADARGARRSPAPEYPDRVDWLGPGAAPRGLRHDGGPRARRSAGVEHWPVVLSASAARGGGLQVPRVRRLLGHGHLRLDPRRRAAAGAVGRSGSG
jgi:hypothetical protein